MVDQGVGDRLQVSGQHVVQLVEREIYTVVGHAVFRKIVSSNALTAVARTDHDLALVGALFKFCLLLQIVDPRLQHA